ncbi:hypothetical protein [Tautonia plasticadhaerens]|uniref:hypothetical protein n=1 Tax=Tautonia plasticadhaerens TaxID=2527974 RepID=UPI00119F55F7|nr:hypothetical protein [Tautonia plasticadhaerens]
MWSTETVSRELAEIAAETDDDELILATQAYHHAVRLRSFELAAGCFASTPHELSQGQDAGHEPVGLGR